jgi:phenylacetate-coenzyme A ligase PaaK-like adenylate-forming protein
MKSLIYPLVDFFTMKQLPHLKKFTKLEKMSIIEIKEFQLERLRRLKIADNWDQFFRLPITTKKDLPERPNNQNNDYHQHETSGSTGEPRVIWVPKDTWYRKDAIFMRSWARIGRKPSDRVLRLMAGEPKYRSYDWWRNVYPWNYRRIDQDAVNFFLRVKPTFIHGPGGAIRQLIELLLDQGYRELVQNLTIEWCSESSFGHKERLEKVVKSFNEQYGLAELPTVGSPDGEGNIRVVMEQGVIEVLNDNNETCLEGEEGYIVVTDFNNDVTPIIRYKSGDRGKIKKYKNRNGIEYFVLCDIVGRGVDFYNGPEVKKPIGWSIVSPISHILGDVIEKWRVEVIPKDRKVVLYVKFIDEQNQDFTKLSEYSKWIYENYGLETEYTILEKEKYDIYFKNKLVKVVE